MPLTIMIWNAQHLDHQGEKLSQAYQDKKNFLDHYLQQVDVDILALMETGKTGKPNERLATDIAGTHTLISSASQEDGIKKDTTLGTMVFIKNSILKEFEPVKNYILSPTEQRSAVIIKHRNSGHGLAFYHANSSYRAMSNIVDTIQYIQGNLEFLDLTSLLFFGGDLNSDGKYSDAQITSKIKTQDGTYGRPYLKPGPPLSKLLPAGSGYTHASFEEIYRPDKKTRYYESLSSFEKRQYKKIHKNATSTYELAGYSQTLRLLDYAYVDDFNNWAATCDASIQDEGKKRKPSRISKGLKMRSDHYPVIFNYHGNLG